MRHVTLALLAMGCGVPDLTEDTDPATPSSADTGSEPVGTEPVDTEPADTDTDTTPPVDLATVLADTEGCLDVTMYARQLDDALALVFSTTGVAEAAHAAHEETTFSWSLPDPAVVLELREGSHVTESTCNDGISYTTVIDETWTAISGDVELVVTPTSPPHPGADFPSDGVLTLTDIVLESPSGASLTLPGLTISAAIGWAPG